jgi:hypothetical protein
MKDHPRSTKVGSRYSRGFRMIRVKRIYEEVRKEDGTRILVDRLWPRGVSKEIVAGRSYY